MDAHPNERPKPRGPFWVPAILALIIAGVAVFVWAPWADSDANPAPEVEASVQDAPASTAP